MTDSTQSQSVHVDILVAEGFVLTELTAVVEVLRVANRVTASPIFSWSFRSRHPGPVNCRAMAQVQAEPIPERPSASYLLCWAIPILTIRICR